LVLGWYALALAVLPSLAVAPGFWRSYDLEKFASRGASANMAARSSAVGCPFILGNVGCKHAHGGALPVHIST
jgi:hypothetical protein